MKKRIHTIGRCCTIRLNDQSVSRLHAELTVSGKYIYLRDMESTNGVFLFKNNRLIPFKEGYVQINQIIKIGNNIYSISQLLEMSGSEICTTERQTLPTVYTGEREHQFWPMVNS